MEAAEAKVQKVLEGSKQFLVPHFQRPYSWKDAEWKTLWGDIRELLDDPDPKPHFLGSIVTSPARSVPEGVEKRLLIDGQQRLTTLIILLALIRDRARETGATRLAERVHDLITNRHEDGFDHYKLLPTQAEDVTESDREAFTNLLNGRPATTRSGIGRAQEFFSSRLRRVDAPDLESLLRVITSKFTLVSIILGEHDNPHRIFESLNGKGRPLSQADLIRNFFFMRLHEREHERVYIDVWRPMQRRLGEEVLTDFVRHYLTRLGGVIRETDVYSALKTRVDSDTGSTPLEHLKEMARYAEYYEVLLRPEQAPTAELRERLQRIGRLEITVAYPFLLGVYADFMSGARTHAEVCQVLDALENYIVRRFVCGIPTYGLNKTFATLYEQARRDSDFVSRVKTMLSSNPRAYPKDNEFRERLTGARLYGNGERQKKTKLILERLEGVLGHKETVGSTLSIEHVMPQTLSQAWKDHLGEAWEDDHEQLLHTLGNLTLTGYNSELGNAPFVEKQQHFATSHIELNRHLASVERWTAQEIQRRAETLVDLAFAAWPYLGPQQAEELATDELDVRGTIPQKLRVRDVETKVESWVEVAVASMERIVEIGEEEFTRVTEELPKFVNRDATAFRASSKLRKLSNGAYVETNLSATTIHRLCLLAARLAGLGADDWSVSFVRAESDGGDSGGGGGAGGSNAKQLQLEFWQSVRPELQTTGRFRSLQTPRPQYWFDIALGRQGIWLSLTANTQEGRVEVKVVLSADKSERALAHLLGQRAEIEEELGMTLEWNPYPDKREKSVKVGQPCLLSNRDSWPQAAAWLTQTAVAFHKAFGPRIAQIEFRA